LAWDIYREHERGGQGVGKKNQRLTERNMIGPVGQRRRVGDAMVDSGVANAHGRDEEAQHPELLQILELEDRDVARSARDDPVIGRR
jgi:hypothetical protein